MKLCSTWSVLWLLAASALPGCGLVYSRYTTMTRDAPAAMVEGGEITPPPDSIQRIAVLRAEIPRTTRDGRAWDTDGLPDAFVVISRNGSEVWRSRAIPNTLRPEWDPTRDFVDLRVTDNDQLRVEVRDDDPIGSDPVGFSAFRGVPSDARNGGVWMIRLEGGATVQLQATPPPPHIGMGVTFDFRGDSLGVVSVVEAGPAYGAGLRAGDRVVAIDAHPLSQLSEIEARDAMDRSATRAVTLTVVHANGAREDLPIRPDALYPAR